MLDRHQRVSFEPTFSSSQSVQQPQEQSEYQQLAESVDKVKAVEIEDKISYWGLAVLGEKDHNTFWAASLL